MSNKRYDQFSTGTPTGSRIMLHADPTTGALEKATVTQIIENASPYDNMFIKLQTLGIQPKAHIGGVNIFQQGAIASVTNNTLFLFPVPTPAFTCTGVYYQLRVSGIFTGNNFNGFALYEIQSGQFVKIAETANNANIWKGTAQIYLTVAFTSTIALTNSIYWIGCLWNASAVTTAPSVISVAGTAFDFAKTMGASSGITIFGSRAPANTFTTPLALTYFTGTTNGFLWGGLY